MAYMNDIFELQDFQLNDFEYSGNRYIFKIMEIGVNQTTFAKEETLLQQFSDVNLMGGFSFSNFIQHGLTNLNIRFIGELNFNISNKTYLIISEQDKKSGKEFEIFKGQITQKIEFFQDKYDGKITQLVVKDNIKTLGDVYAANDIGEYEYEENNKPMLALLNRYVNYANLKLFGCNEETLTVQQFAALKGVLFTVSIDLTQTKINEYSATTTSFKVANNTIEEVINNIITRSSTDLIYYIDGDNVIHISSKKMEDNNNNKRVYQFIKGSYGCTNIQVSTNMEEIKNSIRVYWDAYADPGEGYVEEKDTTSIATYGEKQLVIKDFELNEADARAYALRKIEELKEPTYNIIVDTIRQGNFNVCYDFNGNSIGVGSIQPGDFIMLGNIGDSHIGSTELSNQYVGKKFIVNRVDYSNDSIKITSSPYYDFSQPIANVIEKVLKKKAKKPQGGGGGGEGEPVQYAYIREYITRKDTDQLVNLKIKNGYIVFDVQNVGHAYAQIHKTVVENIQAQLNYRSFITSDNIYIINNERTIGAEKINYTYSNILTTLPQAKRKYLLQFNKFMYVTNNELEKKMLKTMYYYDDILTTLPQAKRKYLLQFNKFMYVTNNETELTYTI